jgi:quinoprotein dehydrogenase-associated probable ABC transporter substrate-binding protein
MFSIGRLTAATMASWLAVVSVWTGDARAEPPELFERSHLRVCADGNNLPFSNRAGEGFENRIAELMAEDLGVPLSYVWAPQVMGFVRNTLETRLCDIIMGVAAGYERVQNTSAYYRSVYAFVLPASSELQPESLQDPALSGRRIGVVVNTPPALPLQQTGALIESYQLQVDTRVSSPIRQAVDDVVSGVTDGAVLWGPVAGYHAARHDPPLRVIPLVGQGHDARLEYRITMGIRRGEVQWKDWINDFIDRHQDDINRILADYDVPLLDRHGQLIEIPSSGE